MLKKLICFVFFGILISMAAACSPAPTVVPLATPLPTVAPTDTLPPMASPTPALPTPPPATATPTASPTPLPVAPTPTTVYLPKGTPIAHLLAGQQIDITRLHMMDANLGWAIGGMEGFGDHVLKTSDGGNRWLDVTPSEPLSSEGHKSALGFFQNAESAWVTYFLGDAPLTAAPVVWNTQDGGQSWQASQPLDVTDLNPEFFYPSHLQFVNSQTGWLLAHVGVGMSHDYIALFRTTDGGQTWTRLLDPYNEGSIQACKKNDFLFADAQNGWLSGDCLGIAPGVILYQTMDGGITWLPVDLPPPADRPTLFSDPDMPVGCGSFSLFFFTAQSGKIVVQCIHFTESPQTSEFFLYSTSDGGISWTLSNYPGGTLTFVSAETGWALGREIYRTTDGGQTWTKISTVNWDAQFTFVSEQLGWAVARSGDQIALVQTSNGGQKWAIILPVIAP